MKNLQFVLLSLLFLFFFSGCKKDNLSNCPNGTINGTYKGIINNASIDFINNGSSISDSLNTVYINQSDCGTATIKNLFLTNESITGQVTLGSGVIIINVLSQTITIKGTKYTITAVLTGVGTAQLSTVEGMAVYNSDGSTAGLIIYKNLVKQ